ncbi:helix-turn-helix domain-containing protein [Arabiibacter massiliensis]|uniref:helix-turn-helix domain-containing protein n=1 Tax=Arabiibacter massiliensis TaxID=1870985 RepID=UPI0009BB5A4B|nr:helix-turn-helix transcriptional regulator [Arabiibacter massiliensis]
MDSKRESLLIAVGAGTNLSLYGIGVWNGSTTLTGGFLFGPAAQAFADWYLWLATLGMLAGIAARACISLRSNESGMFHARTTYAPVVAAAALFLSGLWTSSLPALCVAAFCTGWSFACLSIFWVVRIYRAFDRARVLFPLVLACSALINAVFALAPQGQLHVYLGISLLASALCSALIRVGARPEGPSPRPDPALELRTRYLPAFKSFAGVLFCVAALETIAPTMNYMGLANTLASSVQLGVVCAAQASAAVVLFFVLRHLRAPLHSVQFFKFVTPVLILALFPVPFAGHAYSLAMLYIGSCLHFVVVSSLFCVDAMAIARKGRLTFEFFYAAGLFALMAVCVVLEEVMPLVLQTSSSTDLLVVFGVFFCIYILSMAFMFARRQRQEPPDDSPSTTPAPREADPIPSPSEPTLRARVVQRDCQLSDRETEILELLLRGKNVPAIAEELVISQNTVRSHVKRIYRATGIHTRQELITHCEGIDVERAIRF